MITALLLLAALAVGIVVMITTAKAVFAPALRRQVVTRQADTRFTERAA
jgi:hypothetical protein